MFLRSTGSENKAAVVAVMSATLGGAGIAHPTPREADMGFLDKAKELADQAKGKAGELAEKAGPGASKGLDAAKERIDKATGGKYHDQIESVSNKVGGVLHKEQDGQTPKDQGSTGEGTSGSTGPSATDKPDDPKPDSKS
jgi:hypothetical protein